MTDESRRRFLGRAATAAGSATAFGLAGCVRDAPPADARTETDPPTSDATSGGTEATTTTATPTPAPPDPAFLVVTFDDQVAALDPEAGTARWTRSPVRRISPGAAGDAALFVDVDGGLVAVDVATGDERWTATLDGNLTAVGGSRNGAVLTTDDVVVGLSVADGTVRWRHETETEPATRPVVTTDMALIGLGGGTVLALDHDGTVRWRASPGGQWEYPPAIDGDGAYVVTESRVAAYELAGGEERWSTSGEGDLYGSPVPVGGTVCYASVTEHQIQTPTPEGTPLPTDAMNVDYEVDLVGLDAATGTERWRTTRTYHIDNFTDMRPSPSLAGDAGHVFVADLDRMFAYEAENGQRMWSTDSGGRHPAVAGGVVTTGARGVSFDGSLAWTSPAMDVDVVQPPTPVGPSDVPDAET